MKAQHAAVRVAIVAMMLLQVACGGAQGPGATAPVSAVATLTADSPAWFLPGPIYREPPDFAVASSLLHAAKSRRGPDAALALESIFGQAAMSKERTALASRYGRPSVEVFFTTFSEVLRDFGRASQAAGLSQPPKPVTGAALGSAVIKAGTDKDGYFFTGYMLDHLMSHVTAFQIIRKITADRSFGSKSVATMNSISNRLFYDMARASGVPGVRLATSDWTPSAGIHTVSSRNGGTLQFVYYGTGFAAANEYITRIVAVTPGNLYRFSVLVDPSQISAGEFDLKIDRADGVATYSSVFHGAGKPGRFTTPEWTCPKGIHQALLGMQIVGAVVRPGGKLAFSEPVLETRGQAPLAE